MLQLWGHEDPDVTERLDDNNTMKTMVKVHLCSVCQKSPPILVVKQESNF